MDHNYAVQQVIEKYHEYKKPLYSVFIDYEKSFDAVETGAAMTTLRDQGVEEASVKLLEDLAHKCTGTIILKKSVIFAIRSGVIEEDTISQSYLRLA